MHGGVFVVQILELVVRGFLWVLWFPHLHRLMVSANKTKANINTNAISTLCLRTTRYTACCALDVLNVICTQMRHSHLSVLVGDGSRRIEEIEKISNCAFQCDCFYYYYLASITISRPDVLDDLELRMIVILHRQNLLSLTDEERDDIIYTK